MFGATEFDPSKERGGPPIDEQVDGMAALIKAGKIRHYGLSNETAWGVCEFRRAARELGVPGPVTIQNSYSLVSRGVDNDLAEALFREKMSLLAYSPLGGGMLSGKYLGGAQAAERALHAVRRARPALPQADRARKPSRPTRCSRGGAECRWCNSRSVTSRAAGISARSIIGATSLAQLEEDIAAAQVDLDEATLEAVAAVRCSTRILQAEVSPPRRRPSAVPTGFVLQAPVDTALGLHCAQCAQCAKLHAARTRRHGSIYFALVRCTQ